LSAPAIARPKPPSRSPIGRQPDGTFRFVSGFYVNEKGYLRLSAGPDRGKYVHRKVMETLLAETDTATLAALGIPACSPAKIPEKFTVEHIDHRKPHNCPENLMLLDKRIHDAISLWSRGYYRAHRSPEQPEEPDWVNEISDSEFAEASVLADEYPVLEVCE
jgi:hypothetical protein